MRHHDGFHAGYEIVAAHQARLREERIHDRLARQAMGQATAGNGMPERMYGILRRSQMAIAIIICVPLLYTLNAPHAAAQRTTSHAATAGCVAAAPSSTADAPQAIHSSGRFSRNAPIPF